MGRHIVVYPSWTMDLFGTPVGLVGRGWDTFWDVAGTSKFCEVWVQGVRSVMQDVCVMTVYHVEQACGRGDPDAQRLCVS